MPAHVTDEITRYGRWYVGTSAKRLSRANARLPRKGRCNSLFHPESRVARSSVGALLQDLESGQCLAFEHFEEGTAAGRDVTDL